MRIIKIETGDTLVEISNIADYKIEEIRMLHDNIIGNPDEITLHPDDIPSAVKGVSMAFIHQNLDKAGYSHRRQTEISANAIGLGFMMIATFLKVCEESSDPVVKSAAQAFSAETEIILNKAQDPTNIINVLGQEKVLTQAMEAMTNVGQGVVEGKEESVAMVTDMLS